MSFHNISTIVPYARLEFYNMHTLYLIIYLSHNIGYPIYIYIEEVNLLIQLTIISSLICVAGP